MKRIEAIVRPERLAEISASLEESGFAGFTISDVRGHGKSPERQGEWRGQTYELHVSHKLHIVVMVEDDEVAAAVNAINSGAATGRVGDGLIAVSDVAAIYRIRPTSDATTAEA